LPLQPSTSTSLTSAPFCQKIFAGDYTIKSFVAVIEQHILDTNAGKTTVLSCHICLINTGVEKNELHLSIY
jgi:hypothetical protein